MTDTTNAEPVLPEPSFIIAPNRHSEESCERYGLQCWNAGAEWVAGPLVAANAALSEANASLRERAAELEQEWMKHPQTIEAKAQWDAVALALGADKDCPDAVRAAASRLRAAEIKLRAECEAKDRRIAELQSMLRAARAAREG